MSKKEQFKDFAKRNPSLVNHVNNGSMTWQKFYEIYDIYGEEKSAWEKYLTEDTGDRAGFNLKDLAGLAKNIDVNTIQKHVGTAQKALNLVQEMTSKGLSNLGSGIAGGIAGAQAAKGPKTPRPLNKFFED